MCLSSRVGPGLGVVMATSRRAHTSRYLLGPPPPEPQETLRSGRSAWPRRPWNRCSVLGPSACGTSCTPSQSGVCFLQSCEAPARKPCWPSELGGLGALTPGGEHLWCNYFPDTGCPPAGVGFDYVVKVPLLISLWLLFCLWAQNVFGGGFKSNLSVVVQQSVVILVFSWEAVTWSPTRLLFKYIVILKTSSFLLLIIHKIILLSVPSSWVIVYLQWKVKK